MNARRGGVSRRRFLEGAAALTVAAGLGGLRLATLGASPSTDLVQRLASLLTHRSSAAAFGREVLRERPGEASAAVLLAGLRSTVPDLDRLVREGSDDDLRAAMEAASRRDFASGGDAILRVRGWVVATTEARLCALAAVA